MPKCRVCKEPFTPVTSFEQGCSYDCKLVLANKIIAKNSAKRAKAAKIKAKEERQSIRERKAKLKTRGEWLSEAKDEIQRFRRLEELSKGSGCMSCLRTQEEVTAGDWRPGGYWDGGHFMSKGARPELALEPLNIWLQCKSCNAGSGKYARKGYTVNKNYEENLIQAQGQALVDWLKGPHEPKKYTIDDLKTIISTYKAKLKEIVP